MKPLRAVVYSRQGCHLCEEAVALLLQAGLEVETVDIDAHPPLRERYDRCVPVVLIEGQERFRGRVNPRLLRRLLLAHRWRNWWRGPGEPQSRLAD